MMLHSVTQSIALVSQSSRMVLRRSTVLVSGLLMLLGVTQVLQAQTDSPPQAAPQAVAPAAPKAKAKANGKIQKLIGPMKLTDEAKIARVNEIGSAWLATLSEWHAAHDAELKTLWSEWSKARSVVPKDNFPGELVSTKIEAVYESLKPAYTSFIKQLEELVSPEQIDAMKESWSRSPGMQRTYKAYLEIAPDLADKDKKVIQDRLYLAREASMLTDADKEIVNIYKRHKVKVEEYIGGLEWTKLHKAFANKGKAPKAGESK